MKLKQPTTMKLENKTCLQNGDITTSINPSFSTYDVRIEGQRELLLYNNFSRKSQILTPIAILCGNKTKFRAFLLLLY